jgi:lysine 6-dehydrogenase
MPWTFEGKLRTLQNKTLRHPGHFAQLRAFYDLGLWDTKPVAAGKVQVVPRDLFHALFEPKVTFREDKDLIITRVKAVGKKDGLESEATVEVIDSFDDQTGFSAMERCTGWSAAIVAEMMARSRRDPAPAVSKRWCRRSSMWTNCAAEALRSPKKLSLRIKLGLMRRACK